MTLLKPITAAARSMDQWMMKMTIYHLSTRPISSLFASWKRKIWLTVNFSDRVTPAGMDRSISKSLSSSWMDWVQNLDRKMFTQFIISSIWIRMGSVMRKSSRISSARLQNNMKHIRNEMQAAEEDREQHKLKDQAAWTWPPVVLSITTLQKLKAVWMISFQDMIQCLNQANRKAWYHCSTPNSNWENSIHSGYLPWLTTTERMKSNFKYVCKHLERLCLISHQPF